MGQMSVLIALVRASACVWKHSHIHCLQQHQMTSDPKQSSRYEAMISYVVWTFEIQILHYEYS
jgi:hypothetical protein